MTCLYKRRASPQGQTEPLDVAPCIHVTVGGEAAVGAAKHTLRQRQLRPDAPATGAGQTRTTRVHSHYFPASVFSFAAKPVQEVSPRGIVDGAGQRAARQPEN